MDERPQHRKAQLNVRVSDECHDLVDVISNTYGQTKGSVIEAAGRKWRSHKGFGNATW